MRNFKSAEWWKAVLFRALRTAVVIAIPYVPTVIEDNNWLIVASAAGFGALVSAITNVITGIPETAEQSVPWYYALLERVIKTAGQSLLVAFGTATAFSEVDWSQVLPIVGTAVLGSALIGISGFLPESETPVTAATIPTTVVINNSGDTVQQSVPIVASVDSEAVNSAALDISTPPNTIG